ncbi:MAG: hypothetical protein AB9903_25410 [Vulcanimicrobiota bacterium]
MKKTAVICAVVLFIGIALICPAFSQPPQEFGSPQGGGEDAPPSSMVEDYHDILPDNLTYPRSRYLPAGIEVVALASGAILFLLFWAIDKAIIKSLTKTDDETVNESANESVKENESSKEGVNENARDKASDNVSANETVKESESV